jgi:hypothetical protein
LTLSLDLVIIFLYEVKSQNNRREYIMSKKRGKVKSQLSPIVPTSKKGGKISNADAKGLVQAPAGHDCC